MDAQPDLDPVAILEALLFVSDAPLPLGKFEEVLEGRSRGEIARLLADFQERCRPDDRGVLLIEVRAATAL